MSDSFEYDCIAEHLEGLSKGGWLSISSQTSWITERIKNAKEKGIAVFVDGVSYDQIPKDKIPFVFEEDFYMMDFMGDENGHIVEMNFNKVRYK